MLSRVSKDASMLQIENRYITKKSELYFNKTEEYIFKADAKIKMLENELHTKIQFYSTFDNRF